jgi:uncharacterized membrane protein
MEQDPRFAFRIMVDIANKALSPAINDPTTAVLALDQIHHLLMWVGKRRLDAGETHDAHGRLRLCYGTHRGEWRRKALELPLLLAKKSPAWTV